MADITTGLMLPWGLSMNGMNSKKDRLGELLPMRKLGTTGEMVTMLGVGGYHIGWTTEKDAQEVIEYAMESGIRFFDTAHSYGKGISEERYGKFLIPKYREDIFLMTKTLAKDGQSLLKEVDLSLKRLNTDRVDLLQMHSFANPEDVDQRIEAGVVEAIMKIKESGKARFIGFTGHQNPYAHERMINLLPDDHAFSTLMMHLSLVDFASKHSFVNPVIPMALGKNLGLLAMKTLADGRFFKRKQRNDDVIWETETPFIPDHISIKNALHFAWSMPISTLITGAENKNLLMENVGLAKSFYKLSKTDRAILLQKTLEAPDRDKIEYYKKI